MCSVEEARVVLGKAMASDKQALYAMTDAPPFKPSLNS